jgi:putative redox protein
MPRFTASARSIDGSLRHEVDVNGRHTIVTDLPSSVGGHNAGPAPHELLAATFASCVSTMIVLYGQARDLNLDGIRVDVDYDADATPRQIQTAVHLPAGLTDAQTTAVRRVAETCPVRDALSAGFVFHERLVRDVPASGAFQAAA